MIFQAETQAKIFLLNWAPALVDEGRVGVRAPVVRAQGDDVVHVLRGRDDGAPHHRLGVLLGDDPGLSLLRHAA